MPDAQVLSLSELTLGYTRSVEFCVSAEQMRAFAELSGDFNPLHLDDAFARARGFAGRVVYGALLVAKVSQLIGMELPGRDSVWSSLQLDFRRPLYVGHPARVEAVVDGLSEATRLVQLRLRVSSGSDTLAKGKAEVVLGR